MEFIYLFSDSIFPVFICIFPLPNNNYNFAASVDLYILYDANAINVFWLNISQYIYIYF